MSRKTRNRRPVITDSLDVDRSDQLELELGPLDETGDAKSEYASVPVAVSGGIPGELVVVEITRRYDDRLAAKVVAVKSPSPERVAPPCPYYLVCSGCQLQHLAYEKQLEYKRERVAQALATYRETATATVLPTLPSPSHYGYRNHARFTVNVDGDVGFVNRHTRRLVRVDECLLMTAPINQALQKMQGKARGMTQVSVRASLNTENRLIQPKLKNPAIELESGQVHYEEELSGRRFRVAGSSFFQVNTDQAEALVRMLAERLELTGDEVVVDAYAGVGTYAVLLARLAKRVLAIEESKSAVEDARVNAAGLDNVEFIQARTEDALGQIDCQVDALVLDPPRVGCHPQALAAVRSLLPRRVAMISCDPPSMARDLASLCDGGSFILEDVQPIDMFPQTYHVECLATLGRAA